MRVHQDGAVLSVRFDRPETGNAVDSVMLDELLTVLDSVHGRPGIRVVVLSGAGENFCLGGDRQEFGTEIASDPAGDGIHAIGAKARRVCEALATVDAVTIARVHGQAIGAGVALALFCDLRVGADDSRFRMPELALGHPPAWGGALSRLLLEVGAARIRELVLTGRSFYAAEAERLAVLHRVVPETDLDAAVAEWVKPIVRRSPAAQRTTKAMLNAYAASSRLADITLLDSELLAASVARPPRSARGR
nr:enoyl-CoA hydratase/isomerase family protein [Streptomyces sp. GC420]